MNNYKNLTKKELLKLVYQRDKDIKKAYSAPKKVGIVWNQELNSEQVVLESDSKFAILEHNKSKSIKTSGDTDPPHIFIEGDNYHALQALTYTHRGKVDVIYIDPPYNTGNGFIYNDKWVDKEDGYKHSKWLTMMNNRLWLAKDLLSPNGIIFISIDDNEQANLKLLCNNIFEEKNFVANVPRITKLGSNQGNFYSPSKDYVLVYRSSNRIEKFNEVLSEEYKRKFKDKDEYGHYSTKSLYQSSLDARPNQRYFIECPDGTLAIPPGKMPALKEDASKIKPQCKEDKVWRWSVNSYLKKKGNLVFKKSKRTPLLDEKGNKSKWNVYTKCYLKDKERDGVRPKDWMDKYSTRLGTKELCDMGFSFDFPKSKEMLKYLINISCSKKNSTILDFFAGSGTTGHAVLELNKEDGGTRQFIVCTNNENNIATEICQPRIKKAIKGYKKEKANCHVDGLGGSLHYFKIKFVENIPHEAQLKYNISRESTGLLCLKHKLFDKVSNNQKWDIFASKNKKEFLCIFYEMQGRSLNSFMEAIKRIDGKKYIYLHSRDDIYYFESKFKNMDDYKVFSIPEKIIHSYKTTNKRSKNR